MLALLKRLKLPQSKTLHGVIVDLDLWPGMHLTFEKVYVALTRVKCLEDISLMPTLPGQNLDHLFSLLPDLLMLVWNAGFGPDGIWDAERCKAAMDQLPNEVFKKRKPNCLFRKWEASFQPSSSRAHSSKSSEKERNCDPDHDVGEPFFSSSGKGKPGTGKDKSAMGRKVSPSVTAVFRLDHPILVLQSRAKVFRAFYVPPDGNCLFGSIKTLLNLPIPVAKLRTRVVNFMDGLSPVEQVNIINEHLLLDQAWQKRELQRLGLYVVDNDNDNSDMRQRFPHLSSQKRGDLGILAAHYYLIYDQISKQPFSQAIALSYQAGFIGKFSGHLDSGSQTEGQY